MSNRPLLWIIAVLLTNFVYAQEGEILTIYSGSEFPVHFVDTAGREIFVLPVGDTPVTYFDIITPNTGGYVGPQTFYEGICIVQRKDGSFAWIDKSGKETRRFDRNYARALLPFSQGFCLVKLRLGTSYKDSRYVFLDTLGQEAFGGMRFRQAVPFFNDSSLVQLDNEEGNWAYLNRQGELTHIHDASPHLLRERVHKIETQRSGLIKKIDNDIRELVKIYTEKSEMFTDYEYGRFILEHNFFTNEYRLVDVVSNRILWTSPPEYITFTSLENALQYKGRVTHLSLKEEDLNTFPHALYEFENLTHLTLLSNKTLTEIPGGISALRNLRYLSLQYLSNLEVLPEDILALDKLECIEVINCKSNLKWFAELVEESASLTIVNTMNYDFPDELFKKLIQEKPTLQLNIEFE